ncbi:MAG: ATP-dependent helicase [Methanomassiliicoccaceae archaeon]|nr:ATP-dependent helicase [Methanomassiliicoccaceae archaeon]
MTSLNDCQQRIAETLDGMVIVDAGPGTGKTHTIVQRYLNIRKRDISASDVLMLTFTNNAAAEMEERVKNEMIYAGGDGSVNSSTFDSFCLKVVKESPETVSGFFKTKETLTRNAALIQNETLNREYFRNVYTRFIRRYGHIYGNMPAIVGTSYGGLYEAIQKLMSVGIAPTHDGDWFGRDIGILTGKKDELMTILSDANNIKRRRSKNVRPDRMEEITDDMIREAVNDPRKELLFFINGVYYEYIRSSVADNRLTFGLNALFAFIILYENKNIRKIMSYRYVMVDEFQDTNELQFLISLLILKEPNLCAVGDWKQGIYGFRHASIENITDFEKRLKEMTKFLNKGEKRIISDIPTPVRLPLTDNYRSSQLVIDTAFRSLRCRTRKEETIDTEWLDGNVTELKAARDHGHTEVERLSAHSKEAEIPAILQKIEEYVSDPRYRIIEYDHDGNIKNERAPEYGDIAVLCRNGSMCINVKDAAAEYGIPAHLQGDVDIMATREGKLALAWLRYINNPNDLRGPVAILSDAEYRLAELRDMFPDKRGTDGVPDELKEQMRIIRKKRRRINDLLTSIFNYHGLNNDITQSIISTISSAHRNSMLTIPDIIRLMEADMKDMSKYNVDALLDGGSVMIQTIHKSKGLEYPIVIIGGLNVNIMPSAKNHTDLITFDPLFGVRMKEEYAIIDGHHKIFDCWKWDIVKNVYEPDRDGERRLFFVALSRAKQYITMTCRGDRASTFITDICSGSMKDAEPALERISSKRTDTVFERPSVPDYEIRRKRISLHDIMGEYEESGGGKGVGHGIKVHKDAQRIISGLPPGEENDETRYVRTIIEQMKGAEIMSEIDCTLPIGDVVIAGRIDMLALFDDRVEIRDFKTDMNRSNEHRYVIQMSVYAHAASSLGMPVKCMIDYVSQGISVDVGILSMNEIYERIGRMDAPE